MKRVSVIGLGRIGLPTAMLLEKSGFEVRGVDCDEMRLNAIRRKSLKMDESDLQELFRASSFPVADCPSPSEIFIICVPTPLKEGAKADLSYVESAIERIKPHLAKGNLVIIESTCPVGTTDRIASSFPGVHFAYCPERLMPGNLLKELVESDRVIGGVDLAAGQKAIEFYRTFCKGALYQTEARMAEAVKLVENAYRDVNIAFANEISMIAGAFQLSISELIALANRHPRVNILNPGPGVGGHCIPVDPQFLVEALPLKTKLLQAARAVNEEKRSWVEREIEEAIEEHGCQSIALFGLTYKPNASDFRNSPAFSIYENLRKRYRMIPVDPFYEESASIREAASQAEMLVGLVAHDHFKGIDRRSLEGKILLDFAEVFK